jgi:hypothetical protein
MTVEGDFARNVEISTFKDGSPKAVGLRTCELVRVVQQGGESWTVPLRVSGADVEANIDCLRRSTSIPWVELTSGSDLFTLLPSSGRYHEIALRLDRRVYDHAPRATQAAWTEIVAGHVPLGDVIPFVLGEAPGRGVAIPPALASDFISDIETVCRKRGLLIAWPLKDSLAAFFMAAVWLQRSRLYPMILYSTKHMIVTGLVHRPIHVSRLKFDDLLDEVNRVYGMNTNEVKKAYRVWQLSRSETDQKPMATTPRAISMETADAFLRVLTRARTPAEVGTFARQRAAPVMFEIESSSVSVKRGVSSSDAEQVIRAASRSLLRRVERLRYDANITNVVPSASEILVVASNILRLIENGGFTDGDIIELGLELNALQYHIDPLTTHLSEATLGEVVGMFSTSKIFLGRFPSWIDYTTASARTGAKDDAVGTFHMARSLLEDARGKTFLTAEATQRIDAVLTNLSGDTAAPSLQEGIVRSGENLAAITADGVSRVVARETRQLGTKIKDKAYEEASKSILLFAASHSELLLKFGEARQWPWMQWLEHLLSGGGSS